MNGENSKIGELVVKVRAGFGLYPLEDVLVTVISEDNENSTVVAEVYTDETGSTPVIPLIFAEAEDETNLNPKVQRYTVEAEKKGFQKVILHGVEVLAGTKTVQLINLAALPDKKGLNLTDYDEELIISENR